MRNLTPCLVIVTLASAVSPQFLTIFEPASTRALPHPISGRDVPLDPSSNISITESDMLQLSGIYNPNKPADSAALKKYREKGAFLLCLLNATDEEAGKAWPDPYKRTPASASSLFKGTLEKDMESWYWLSASSDQDFSATFSDGDGEHPSKIGTALAALGLSDQPSEKGGQNQGYAILHYNEQYVESDQKYTGPDGAFHMATGGTYRFAVNQAGGAIFAQRLLSPAHAIRQEWNREASADELPPLRLASDIISAYWLRGNSNAKKLKYYCVNGVVNDITLELIAAVLKNKAVNEVPTWPGVKLSVGSDEGAEILLGSPMGATLAYLLIQHKDELGIKTVTGVHVFRDNSQGKDGVLNVHLLFMIKDGAPATEHGKTGDGGQALEVRNGARSIMRTHMLLSKGGIVQMSVL